MKILVTGGTGFLGRHVVERLAAAGHQVRVMARNEPASATSTDNGTPPSPHSSPSRARGNVRGRRNADGREDATGRGHFSAKVSPTRVEFVRANLENERDVRAALQGIEVVYHLAGTVSFNPVDGRSMYRVHVDCSKQLLELAREEQIGRFILASTSGTIAVSREPHVGTEADDYPITVVGRWPYYLSKIYQEKLTIEFCRKNSIPLVVLNPSLLLGPGDDRLSSTWLITKFLNQQIPSMPNGAFSFVDARDAADVFVNALTRGELYGRHLFGINMSFPEFFGRLERLTKIPAPKLHLPARLNIAGAILLEKWARLRGTDAPVDRHSVEIGEHFFTLDSSKTERELGYNPRDPEETLFDTLRYIQAKLPHTPAKTPPKPPPLKSIAHDS